MARGHSAHSLTGSHGEARAVSQLDAPARDICVLVEPARYVPGALGRPHLGPRICDRSGARRVCPDVSDLVYRRSADTVRVASSQARLPRRPPTLVAPRIPAPLTHPA